MKYELNNNRGFVAFHLKTGSDWVKNTMSFENAMSFITNANTLTASTEIEGYPICVNGVWFFEGTVTPEKKSKAPVEEEA